MISCRHLSDGKQTKDLCKAFSENGFKISYGFNIELPNKKAFIFIDHHYWELYWTTITGLHLYSNESKVISNYFGNEYRNAFRIKFCEQSLCEWFTGLYDVSPLMIISNVCKIWQIFWFQYRIHSIKWAPILLYTDTKGSSIIRKYMDYNRYSLNSSNIEFESNFNPSMAFGVWNNIIFIDQKSLNTTLIQYIRTYRMFETQLNSYELINATDNMINLWKKYMNEHNIKYGNDESEKRSPSHIVS